MEESSNSGICRHPLQSQRLWVNKILSSMRAFSPDGRTLAVVGDDAGVAPNKQFLLKVEQWVGAMAFSPDGRWLATPSQYAARLWDLNKPDPSSELLILPGHEAAIADLAFSPDGKWFATRSGDFTVQLWKVADRFTRLLSCMATRDRSLA